MFSTGIPRTFNWISKTGTINRRFLYTNRNGSNINQWNIIMFRFNKASNILKNLKNKINFRKFATNTTKDKKAKAPTGLKKLMQEYGYSALGVYLGLSCIDLPLCYLLVHSLGQEKISQLQESVKSFFGFGKTEDEKEEEESKEVASTFWTEFAVAYGIHKSLIFIRVPITAAITPGIVGMLRKWGFHIGHTKLSTVANATKSSLKDSGIKHVVSEKGVKNILKEANEKSTVLRSKK